MKLLRLIRARFLLNRMQKLNNRYADTVRLIDDLTAAVKNRKITYEQAKSVMAGIEAETALRQQKYEKMKRKVEKILSKTKREMK